MLCKQCGAENAAHRRFCSQCGEGLSRSCPQCAFDNDPADRFCGGCGHALDPEDEKHAESPQSVSPPAGDVDGDTGSEAERRQLTVMFCDLADSTAMSTRLDPEDLSKLNRLYQETCSAVIEEYDGYIARYMGDGILCYFGYPRAHEDDAARSVHAALKIQAQMQKLNDDAAESEQMAVRIGIATGPVVVGEVVGTGAARESTAVGKTPNLAARLQSLADPGKIVIADETRSLAGKLFEFRCLGKNTLKGIAGAVEAWEVVGTSSTSSRFEARGKQKLTPFVGRKHEQALIEDCYQQAKEGQGQTIMLCGEPGIGKSRLIQIATDLNPGSAVILQCSSHHVNSSLYPLVEYLRSIPGVSNEKDRSGLHRLLVDRNIQDPDAAGLFELLVFGNTDLQISIPSAQLQKQHTLELAADLLIKAVNESPAIVVIEDIHWMDPTSQKLVNNLVFSTAQNPILLLLSFRPEYKPVWVGQSHVHQLNLNRINNEQCHEMIASLMGTDIPENLAATIVERTDGIPLYVEELVQSLGRGAEDDDGRHFEVPATLADSLNARLDSLGPARRTAQAAAVIGRDFGLDLLQAVTRTDRAKLEKEVSALLESGLVYPMADLDGGNYRFKHALIQDAAYGSLLRDHRTHFHRRAASFLENTSEAERRIAGLVSHHHIQAGDFFNGARYARMAGEFSLESMAIVESQEHFSKSLQAIGEVEESGDTRPEELAAHLGLAACYRIQENYEKALASLDDAEDIALELDNVRALADICHTRGNIYFPLGERDGILREHTRALQYARQSGSIELEARSIGGLGDAYYLRGEMQEATKQFIECCRISEENNFLEYDAANRAMIGWSRLYELEFPEARDDALKGVELATKCGHFRGELISRSLLVFVYAEMMEPELCQQQADIALKIAVKMGSMNYRAAVILFSTRAMDEHTQRAKMYELAAEAVEASRKYGHSFHGPGVLGGLLLASEDPEERKALVIEAEDVLEKGCVPHNYFWFYQAALQSAVNNRDWEQLQYFREQLEKSDLSPMTKWSSFFINRSIVLEHFYRGRVNDAVESQRLELIDICRRHSMFKSLIELETVAS